MTTEPLSPHDLARLLLDAAPHLDLIERVAPHLPVLRSFLPMLDQWNAVEADLEWAKNAPAHLQATAHQAIFLMLSKKHGGSTELWGAVGLEMKQRKPAPKKTGPKGGGVPTVRTPEETAHIRARLVLAGQLARKLGMTSEGLAKTLEAQCSVKIHYVTLGNLRSGLYVRKLEQGDWPGLSTRLLEEVIAGMELLSETHVQP